MADRTDGDGPGEGALPPASPGTAPARVAADEWAARRAALSEKLAERSVARAQETERQSGSGSSMRGMAEGLKLASEFAAGIIVGGGIGFLIDKTAGIAPFGLILFLMFGFAAGIRNVLRHVSPKPPTAAPKATADAERAEKPRNS